MEILASRPEVTCPRASGIVANLSLSLAVSFLDQVAVIGFENRGKALSDIRSAIRRASLDEHVATCEALSRRWLAKNPDDIWVVHKLAESLYTMARFEEALEIYRAAEARFPDWRWGIFNQIGHLYRYRGEFDQAASWYQRAIEDDPDEAASYIFLGAIKARQGKLVEAEEIHRRATGCSEGMIEEAYLNLGLVLRGQGRLLESADCLRQALKIAPTYAEAKQVLEDVLRAHEILMDDIEK